VIVSSSLEVVRFLTNKGADLNSADPGNNKSVLMAAILRKKPELVKFLLSRGANPFYENFNGRNCFQIARGLEYRVFMYCICIKPLMKLIANPKTEMCNVLNI